MKYKLLRKVCQINMDKVGYKAYLQLLGNKQHYIGRIPELIELEKTLNIDLDDYVPYNGDYSKVSALYAALPEEVLCNEKLQFSINSYMRYRLSGFDKEERFETDERLNCAEYFTFHGTESELKQKLSLFMSEEDSLAFINGIQNYLQLLEEDEFIEKTISFSQTDSKMLNLLIQSSDYNINLRALTLTALALVLDIKLTIGIAATTLAILGFNNQAIVRIDASESEKCLILEAINSKKRVIDEDVFSVCNHQYVHNDLNCKYRDGDTCTINKENINAILDGLCDKNTFNFKKIHKFYKYNF